MVARYVGAGLAFFAFAVAVIAGLSVGNPPYTVLSRGLIALFLFFFIGLTLGGAAQLVLREYRARRADDLHKRFDAAPATTDVAGPEQVPPGSVSVGA